MADASPGAADDPTAKLAVTTAPELVSATSNAAAPAVAAPPSPRSTTAAAPAPEAAALSTPVYSIFAPRSATKSAISSTNGGDLLTTTAGPAAAAASSKSKKANTTKKAKQLQGDEENSGSVVSLIDESSGSDVEPAKKGSSKRIGKPTTKKATAATAKQGKGKGKGKGRARDEDEEVEVVSVRKRASRSKARKAIPTTDEDGSDRDEDDAIVVSEAGSSTSMPAPRAKKSRQSTPLAGPSTLTQAVARTASGSAILDLTDSPPRPHPRTSPKRKRDKAAASSSSMTTSGFAPLAEVYGAAREKRRKGQEGVEPRWPTAEEHVGGWPVAGASACGDRAGSLDKGKGKALADLDDDEDRDEPLLERYRRSFGEAGVSGEQTPAYRTTLHPLSSLPFLLPSPLPAHPLLDRLAEPLRAGRMPDRLQGSDTIWTTKYAPQTAEEVLGTTSQQSAMWLKDWLEELKVVGASEAKKAGSKRRRKVERGIDPTKKKKRKKRRPEGLDDFLASSEEDEDDDRHQRSSPFDSDDSDDDIASGDLRGNRKVGSSVFPTLTNLILLQGPHGSGKSSTVHAVARQLGYEVFEVFPGLGRRAAKDLERYVGDAARNHVVNGGSPRKKGAAGAFAALFGKQKAQANGSKTGSAAASKAQTPDPIATGPAAADLGPTQSLILIDEVDVFFRHEEDCWAGIAALASQSRRPIIMTCTDSFHVPFDTLNLQRVSLATSTVQYLPFGAPEEPVSTAFLSLVALSEGHLIPAASIADLYQGTTNRPYPAWMLQQQMGTARRAGGGGFGARPLPPGSATQPLSSPDLRKALVQLELECQRGTDVGSVTQAGQVVFCESPLLSRRRDEEEAVAAATGPTREATLQMAAAASDALSWADAYVDRRIETMIEDAETGRTSHPNDFEYSHPIVEYLPDPNSTRLPFVGAEREMARYLRELAERAWGDAHPFGEHEDEKLETDRGLYTTWLGMLIHGAGDQAIVQPPSAVLPSHLPVTEVVPLLRHLTHLDDEGERALLEAARSAAAQGDQDELDSLSVAAALYSAAGPGAQIGPRRSTRQQIKQGGGQPVFRRRLPWASQVEADWLRNSGFNV